MQIAVSFYTYYPSGWQLKATNSWIYTQECQIDLAGEEEWEYCDPILGMWSFFADVFISPDKKVYWDKYFIEWDEFNP